MKKPLTAFFAGLILALFFPLHAETDWHLAVEPLFGLIYGQMDEYVFLKNSAHPSDKLSELNWEIKPAAYLGACVSGGCKAFTASVYLTSALPSQTGSMSDSDWKNLMYTNADTALYKTNFSESETELSSFYTWGISAAYTCKPVSFFSITPEIGFKSNYFKFTADNATYCYGNTIGLTQCLNAGPWYDTSDTANCSTGEFSGKLISYERISYMAWLGVSIALQLPRLTCSLGALASPFCYSYATDKHYKTNFEYADVASKTFAAYKLTSSISYTFSKHIALSVHGDYFFYFQPMRTDTYAAVIGSSTYETMSDEEGGIGGHYLDAGISLKYTFF